MVGIQQSTQQQTLTFSAPPETVAQAIEAAIATVGKVTSADPTTGRITGEVKGGLKAWEENARIDIMVSHVNDQTQVQIETSHDEGAIYMHGAQKKMDAFLQALREQPALTNAGTAGW